MKFLDLTKVHLKSGAGGNGCVSFRRAAHEEFGGPDGGNGGQGGDVFAEAVEGLNTLIDFRYQQHFFAKNGRPGMGKQRSGKDGDDIILKVPVGTEILEEDEETIVADLTVVGQRVLLAKGGNGGFGNLHFKSSTKQTPRYAQPGMKGVQRFVTLELKLLADVGLVGFPNAGKSTLLAALTSAKPKIADYEFTTLKPNLGIVHYRDYRSFVMADIPGIIEGAAQGKGLGHYFLRHIERNSVLLYVIPADAKDVKKQFEILRSELQEFNPELLDKQYMVVLSCGTG